MNEVVTDEEVPGSLPWNNTHLFPSTKWMRHTLKGISKGREVTAGAGRGRGQKREEKEEREVGKKRVTGRERTKIINLRQFRRGTGRHSLTFTLMWIICMITLIQGLVWWHSELSHSLQYEHLVSDPRFESPQQLFQFRYLLISLGELWMMVQVLRSLPPTQRDPNGVRGQLWPFSFGKQTT